jgi:hypothetical protein
MTQNTERKADPKIARSIDSARTNLTALLSTAASVRREALLKELGLPPDASTKAIVAKLRDTRPNFMGVEVNWSFGDGDGVAVSIPREHVRDELVKAGFPRALVMPDEPHKTKQDPKPITIVVAMRTTARLGFGRVQVDKLAAPNPDTPAAFGFKVQEKGEGEKGDRWPMGARVRVDPHTGEAVALPPEGQTQFTIKVCEKAAKRFAAIANMMVTHATNRDLSQALLDAVCRVDGIGRIRNRGGSYMIPDGEDLDRFVDLLDALRDATANESLAHRFVPDVEPKYSDPLSVAMWQRRAVEDFATDIDSLLNDLRTANDPNENMRVSTIEKRRDDVVGLVARANRMRDMLAENLSEITTLLNGLKSDFDAALKAALADADAADNALAAASDAVKAKVARKPAAKRASRPRKGAKTQPKPADAPQAKTQPKPADAPQATFGIDLDAFEALFRF